MTSFQFKLVFVCAILIHRQRLVNGVNECADSSQNDCHPHATCTDKPEGYSCKCKAGFKDVDEGNTQGVECIDVDECSTGNNNCDNSAACVNAVGTYSCTCSSGYFWKANLMRCKDIDECSSNTDNCHNQLATCINKAGGFDCKCKAGYTGDGVSCSDEDECNTGSHKCTGGSQCINTQGSYTCKCASGLKWNAKKLKCQDVDECKERTDDCISLTSCKNTRGSYECNCIAGYTGSDNSCSDLNECASPSSHTCSSNGACINLEGTYECNCEPGYEWDAGKMSCEDVDECRQGTDDCSLLADCTNSEGSFICECITGFTGNGVHCAGPGGSSCSVKADVAFVLHTASHGDVFAQLKMFLKLAGAKFTISQGNRLGVSLYGTTVSHKVSLDASKDNKGFISAVDSLKPLVEGDRLDLAIHDTFNTHFNPKHVSVSGYAKVMVLVVSDNVNRPSVHCPSYIQPYELAKRMYAAGVRVMVAAVAVNISEDYKEFVETDNEIWYFNDYEQLFSKAGDFAIDVCRTAVRSRGLPYCSVEGDYCQENGECHKSGATYHCNNCKLGYKLKGDRCDEVNECDISSTSIMCSNNNGDCINTAGSYICICKTGFRREGSSCIDMSGSENGVLREVYTSISGDTVEELYRSDKFPNKPDISEVLSKFDATFNDTEGYGQRLSAFYQPPETGSYVFTLSCESSCELWLSGDDTEANLTRVLKLEPWKSTEYQQWDKYLAEQESGTFQLSGGFSYLIRAQMKAGAGVGSGHISVGVQTPSAGIQRHLLSKHALVYKNLCAVGQTCQSNSECINRRGSTTCRCVPGFQGNDWSCHAPQQCPVVIDLVFLLDTSSNVLSIENFKRQKLFIQQIISRFNITNSSRVSIIPYSDIPHEAKILSTQNRSVGVFAEDFRDLQFLMGGCSRHDLALDISHSYLMKSGGPSGGQKVVVLITTAKQPQHPQLTPRYVRIETTTARLRDAGVFTFAVGFGDAVQERDLESLATEKPMVFVFESFDNVTENALVVYKRLCKSSAKSLVVNICPLYAEVTQCQDHASCINTANTHQCLCDLGFVPNGNLCFDFDECSNGSHKCVEIATCKNTEGSYWCKCPAGYVTNGTNCDDIDECLRNTHRCHSRANCINTVGSYNCSCKPGFTGNGRKNCNDINECEILPDACHKDAYCKNKHGYHECTCVPGYSGNGSSCTAPEKCLVPVGIIFAIDASGSVGRDNYEKQKDFMKILASRYDLENSQGGVAAIVFSNHASNEIQLGEMKSAISFATAVDKIPYFQAFTRIDLALRLAYDEYFFASSNETQRLLILLTDGKQTRNDFMKPEYVPISDTVQLLRSKSARIFAVGIGPSVDLTEMRLLTEQQDDIFLATEFNDLVLKADTIAKTTCAVVLQEKGVTVCSADVDITSCHYGAHCVNTSNNFTCLCKNGFVGNALQCDDIDECADGSHGCPASASCVNTAGSYYCSCKLEGYSYNGSMCVDIDECAKDWDECNDTLTTCVNLLGSYNCTCPEKNFAWNGQICVDIDECAEGLHDCIAPAKCVNIASSYNCSCNHPGSVKNGSSCIDIDECAQELDDCNDMITKCVNTPGSYKCLCHQENYAWDGNSCIDKDECEDPARCSANSSCTNLNGSYECNCSAKESHLCYGTSLCGSPQVRIINVGRTADQPMEFQLSSYYTFTANVELRCATIRTQNMSWIIANTSLNDFEALANGTILSSGSKNWKPSKQHAEFANVVHTLIFSFTVVQQEDNVTRTAFDKGFILLRLPPLVAIISGETEITKGDTQMIVLNGSESFDPIVGPGHLDLLTFYWICGRSSEKFPSEHPLVFQVVPTTLSSLEPSRGGCFGTGTGRLDSNEPLVMLNASLLESSNATYVFKLFVTKDVRSANDEKLVEVVEGNPPEVSLNFVLNDRLNVISTAPLTISADYMGYQCNDDVEYQWILYQEDNNTGWLKTFNQPERTKVFSIDPKILQDNTKYRLELTVILGNETPSKSVQVFKTALLPKEGSCIVTPNTGEAVYTSFELRCFGWFAANETFTYEVQISGEGSIYYTYYYGYSAKQQLVLPQGNASHGYWSNVKVFISRSNGATTELDVPVRVTPPKSNASTDLFELLVQNTSAFEDYLLSMDSHKAWQLMTAMLLTTEAQELIDGSSSEKSLQQRIAQRDVALRRLQMNEFKDLPGLVFVSAFLASAGRNLPELSYLSKRYLPQIFGNMSDTILNKASNLNANDERYISQGVYNMLFGTVELLMVSAEEAKVTKESGLSAANRSQEMEIVLKSIHIIRTLLRTLTTRLAVSQSPRSMQVMGLDFTAGRETSCGLESKTLNGSEGEGFVLPPNMRKAFGEIDLDSIDFQLIHTKFNPYLWHQTHQEVRSEILSLEFSDDNGNVLPVGGDDVDIDIDIKIPLLSGNASSNNFFIRPLTMRYHIVALDDISDSIILEVKPINRSLMMVVYVKHGGRPTLNDFDFYAVIPDYSSCRYDALNGNLVLKCVTSPYEVMSTRDFNQTGLYYVGVLYIEKSQLNHTRTRRSCFGRKRQRRDCVEPKPPPVRGIEYNRTLTYNPATDQNYSVKVQKYSCYYFSLTQNRWSKDGCKVGDETNEQLLHCRCNHLTAFAGGFLIAPNPIDFDKVFVEFTRLGETGNYVVLSTVCAIFGVYLLVIIWARKADMLDERKLGPTVNIKSNANSAHKYDVTIITGVWRQAGTSSSVFAKFYGTENCTKDVNLTGNGPPGRKLFARGSIDRFVLHCDSPLGSVFKVEMWHDNSGKNSSWFLDQVHIVERSTGEKWDFFHHNWLALHKGNGTTTVTLMSHDNGQHSPGFKSMFHSLAAAELADYHIWASVVARPPRNSFTRVQRASCCLSFLYLAMVCNAMFYLVVGGSEELIQIGPLQMSLRQLVIGIESTLIVTPVSVLITALFRFRKAKTNGESEESDSNNNPSEMSYVKNKKKQFLLPHTFVYPAWFLCIATAATAATFTVFYSLQWGKEIADQWLASVVVSCVEDVFIWQPSKVLVLALLLILIFQRPKPPDETGNCDGTSFSEEIQEQRAYELRKAKFFRFARQFMAFLAFYLLLMMVAYGDKGHHRYLMTKATRDGFAYFYKVNTGDKMWDYMLGKFIHDSYAGDWYNGQFEPTTEYIGNKASMLIGMPRLRQLRIEEESCSVVKELREMIYKCYDFYSMSEEDTTRLYLPHWVHLSDSQLSWNNLSQLCPRPWRYSTAEELNNFPSWAQHHIYGGGGYVLDLGYDKPTAIRMMEAVKEKDWIDRRTRAILLEFQVLNLNTNLMSIITYHYEVLPLGFGLTYERIDTIKLFNFESISYSFYLMCQLIFIFMVLVYITILLIRLCREGGAFFKRISNWIDVGQIVSALLAVVFYVMKAKFMHDSIQEVQRNPFVTVSFQFAIFWTEMENTALSFALFIATFKILHFIRLNPQVQILAWTLAIAKHDIYSISVLFGILFIAHGHFAYIVFGSSVFSFSSFIRAFASEFELALGNTFHVVQLDDVNRIFGNLFTASFMVTLAILLVNIFVSILDINLHDVKDDEEKLEEAYGMAEFIKTLLFGLDRKKEEDTGL